MRQQAVSVFIATSNLAYPTPIILAKVLEHLLYFSMHRANFPFFSLQNNIRDVESLSKSTQATKPLAQHCFKERGDH